ncbi:MAG: FG-GAP repeat protein [Planctomycetes bacterium]|nr:FG-GAP repeat protein [Planctomycetota bacterium]
MSSPLPSLAAQTTLFSTDTSGFGNPTSLDGGGDVDGDGTPDFITSAFSTTGTIVWSGASGAQILTLKLPYSPVLLLYGTSVADIGDVNLDGRRDIAVGAPMNDKPYGYDLIPGMVFVCSGADGSLMYRVAGVDNSATVNDFGKSVSAIGDITGDGIPDFAAADPGLAFVRVISGWDGLVQMHVQSSGGFGASMSGAGDVNLDGFVDLVVSRPGGSPPSVQVRSGLDMLVVCEFLAAAPFFLYGFAVSGGSDVDADGVPDILVGDPGHIGSPAFPGAAYLYSGASGVLLRTHMGTHASSRFGAGVEFLKDATGDGIDDYGIAAPNDTAFGTGPESGAVRLFSGATGAVSSTVHLKGAAGSAGRLMASVNDLNGDGLSDLVASDPPNIAVRAVSFAPGLQQYGFPTNACLGDQIMNATRVPKLGESAFEFTCTGLLSGAASICVVTDRALIPPEDPFQLGLQMHIDLLGASETFAIPMVTNAAGFGIAPAPIPNDAALVNRSYFAQTITLFPPGSCLPWQTLSASRALVVTLLL